MTTHDMTIMTIYDIDTINECLNEDFKQFMEDSKDADDTYERCLENINNCGGDKKNGYCPYDADYERTCRYLAGAERKKCLAYVKNYIIEHYAQYDYTPDWSEYTFWRIMNTYAACYFQVHKDELWNEAIRTRLDSITDEQKEHKMWSMDINFLKDMLFPNMEMDESEVIQEMLLNDCTWDSLEYYTEREPSIMPTYYNERWFLTDGTYCVSFVASNVSTSSPYACMRINLPDYNDDE